MTTTMRISGWLWYRTGNTNVVVKATQRYEGPQYQQAVFSLVIPNRRFPLRLNSWRKCEECGKKAESTWNLRENQRNLLEFIRNLRQIRQLF